MSRKIKAKNTSLFLPLILKIYNIMKGLFLLLLSPMSQAVFVQLQFSPRCSIRMVNSQDYRKSSRRLCSNHIYHHQRRTLKPSSSAEDSLPCKAKAHGTSAHRTRAQRTRAHHTRPTTPGPTTSVEWGGYERRWTEGRRALIMPFRVPDLLLLLPLSTSSQVIPTAAAQTAHPWAA